MRIRKHTHTIIVIFVLALCWFVQASFSIYKEDLGVPTLNDRFGFNDFSRSSKAMYQNDVIGATFKSTYPNLGIVEVRFNIFKRVSDDILTFRFREKGQTEWSYQANYKTDQFQDNQLFPFGFPLIKDSQNKEYEFEIVSLRGDKKNNVGVSTSFPSFTAKHIYTKSQLKDRKELFNFLLNKCLNVISDRNVILLSFAYIIPFLIYTQIKKVLVYKKFKRFISYTLTGAKIIVFLSILLEIIIGEAGYTGFFLSILLLWILTIRKYDLKYLQSAAMAGYLIIFVPFLMVFGFNKAAEILFEWVFIFFTTGVVQLLVQPYLVKR